MVNYKPQLHLTNGCHPYPAVDEDGNTNGGLAPSGGSESGCSKSTGQVYGRSTWYNGVHAMMYSWYFPKDEPSTGIGHRHDWENVVVWIDDPAAASPTIYAVAASAHSGYSHYYPPDSDNLDGKSAKIDYYSAWPIDHRFRITTKSGGTHPLIQWDQLPDAAVTALTDTDFGSANVPFKDSNFLTKIAEACFCLNPVESETAISSQRRKPVFYHTLDPTIDHFGIRVFPRKSIRISSKSVSMFTRSLFALAVSAFAATSQASVLDVDAVVGFTQPTPTTTNQTAMVTYKPQLHLTNGCHPYPAVDEDGNTNGGLAPSGGSESGCSSSTGQVYGRSTWYNGRHAMMYSWYFPKDEPSTGIGHRHDWENVVVWIDNPAAASPTIYAVAASAHSGYSHYYPPTSDEIDGTSAKIDYYSAWPIDHRFRITTDSGGTHPLIQWDQLPDAAVTALTDTDFGDANVPFKDANFLTKIAEAWYE